MRQLEHSLLSYRIPGSMALEAFYSSVGTLVTLLVTSSKATCTFCPELGSWVDFPLSLCKRIFLCSFAHSFQHAFIGYTFVTVSGFCLELVFIPLPASLLS